VSKKGQVGEVYRDMQRFYGSPVVKSAAKGIKEKQEHLWADMASKCCMSVEGAP
jgi:hypothetical protein